MNASPCSPPSPWRIAQTAERRHNAQPFNGDDCSLGILFAEHMSNALTPCTRGERVLMRSGGPLDGFPDLLRNRSKPISWSRPLQQSLAHPHLASAMPSSAQLEWLQPQLEERWL